MKKLMLVFAVCAMAFSLFAKDDFFPPVKPRNSLNLFSYNAVKFGFEENLRTNQVVKNVKLVDQVVAVRNGRAQIIKAGDFQMIVTSFVEDKKLGIKAFSGIVVSADPTALVAAMDAYETSGTIPTVQPVTEIVSFVGYNGKTFTFYKSSN